MNNPSSDPGSPLLSFTRNEFGLVLKDNNPGQIFGIEIVVYKIETKSDKSTISPALFLCVPLYSAWCCDVYVQEVCWEG